MAYLFSDVKFCAAIILSGTAATNLDAAAHLR
ncbi:Unannotated [Lentimonas sp. CC4]|nr:Unannotated [Lentimonas sp. CC4]CAA6686741.1 Unannotated [Lentimonas sp. CC6]CAA7075682.1 Unannotated [Lentimonas sp. CC4]CAA7168160.1 Unannotated [Lentimonas sp. CC21]CAA7181691.1 Unannotated [Lentimonas sp. CC8]